MKFNTKALLSAGALAMMAGSASAADLTCLITKNNTNPFFVKMKEGAEAKAAEMGLDFQAYAGVTDGDAAPQITAIENCVAAGAKGILITASNDSSAMRSACTRASTNASYSSRFKGQLM